jgi:hypothetical protein
VILSIIAQSIMTVVSIVFAILLMTLTASHQLDRFRPSMTGSAQGQLLSFERSGRQNSPVCLNRQRAKKLTPRFRRKGVVGITHGGRTPCTTR